LRGAIPPLPKYVFIAWFWLSTGTTLPLLSNSTDQSVSWKANSHSSNQEFPCLLWIPKVYYRVNKNAQLFPILSHVHLVYTFPPYFTKIHSNIISPLSLGLRSGLFPSGIQMYHSLNFVYTSFVPSSRKSNDRF
jgi:hypothetical protein